ncbi:MAG: hypothetical protein E7660_02340 [Ruminococcaceae bacterium]|nr:hypothetical protein [Oscillospiraceae bacterium]
MAKDAKTKNEIKAEHKVQKAERRAAAAKAKKKANLSNTIILVSVILLFAVAIGLFGYKTVITSGIIDRCTTVVSSENFSVNNAMMTYYFNSVYQNFAGQYGSSLSSFGLDTSKDLKSQTSIDGQTSWYDYFMTQTESQVQQYLILAEAAKANGVELDEHDMHEIDELINDYKEGAKQYGYDANSYVKLIFGTAVKLSDMKDALVLAQLASKYSEELGESYEFTADDYAADYEAHPENYLKIDYLKYAFTAEKGDDGKVKEESKAEMKTKADTLAAVASAEDFNAYITNALTEEAKAELKEGEEVNADEIQAKVDTYKTEGALTNSLTGDDLKKWAASAAAGETYVDASDTTGTYTVYMLLTPEYKDTYVTKNGAYLFLSDTTYPSTDSANAGAGSAAKADEIIAEWEAAGKGEEAFLEMVEKYSEAGHAHLEENLTKDVPFADGLYAEDAAVGGVKKIYSESDKGTYLVYLAGDGVEAWEAAADTTLRNEAYSADFTEFAGIYWVYANEKNLDKVIPVAMSK